MLFIILLLAFISIGSFIWSVIQIIKPEWFYLAENEANIKRKRPWWYLASGILGLVVLLVLWMQAFALKLNAVWIFTAVFTLGSLKPLGMVFFYEKFSEKASSIVHKMQDSKKTYTTVVALRLIISIVSLATMLYFINLSEILVK